MCKKHKIEKRQPDRQNLRLLRPLFDMVRALCLLFASAAAFAPSAVPRGVTCVRSEAPGSFRYDNSESISPLEKKQALQDTASWCLERCIKLGHCEVFEDLNKMTTAQVQDFCKACVITGESTVDECDVSMMFIDDAPWAGIPKPAGV